MKKIGFIFLLLMVVTAAHAANWRFVTISSSSSLYYIDAETIREESIGYPVKKVKFAWFKVDHSGDKTTSDRQSKLLYQFDCNRSELKLLQWIAYAPNGEINGSGSTPSYQSSTIAAPETVGHSLLKAACFSNYQME